MIISEHRSTTYPEKLEFLPSIEGMRGLAVISVLLYHLELTFVPSGFLGVDLFFVISGYIITRNLLFDIGNNQFSLKSFYYRRFRRLYPALLVTVFLTLVTAALFIPPAEIIETAKSAIYSVFSVANFYFWKSWNYFDIGADTKPLLHTWSLSVEEQFYLFWPALLLLAHKCKTRAPIILILTLLSLSIIISGFYSSNNPSAVFYLLPFRVHQLMAGAIIAAFMIQVRGKISNSLSLMGVIVYLYIITRDMTGIPWLSAISISLIGFVLIVTQKSTFSSLFFGNHLMQWLGKISYTLYLVHWPIIVLSKYYYGFQLTYQITLGLFLASFVIASALHYWVEKPFRLNKSTTPPSQLPANSIVLFLLSCTLVISIIYIRTGGLPSRIDPEIYQVISQSEAIKNDRIKTIRTGICNMHPQHSLEKYNEKLCADVQEEKTNVLILGDSYASDSYMILSYAFPDLALLQATRSACPALINLDSNRSKKCKIFNSYRFSILAKRDVDVVILASRWKTRQVPALKETVEYLNSLGKQVIIFAPGISFKKSVPILLANQLTLSTANNTFAKYAKIDKTEKIVQSLRENIPQAEVIDIASLQCEPRCTVVEDGQLLYIDSFHLSAKGAEVTSRKLPGILNFAKY